MRLQPVILCGGSGTRLWPLSREKYPKQFLALNGTNTLLQDTALRADLSSAPGSRDSIPPIVVTSEECRFLTAEQLRQAGIKTTSIVLEPAGRNTAPALTLAAMISLQDGKDPILLVMPADHVIDDTPAFQAAVGQGYEHAKSGKLITFGIKPDRPDTGYGYIRATGSPDSKTGALEIGAFAEKPDAETAKRYMATGEYLWNSGIFMMRASVWLAQLNATRPDIVIACRKAFDERSADQDFLRVGKEAFSACPADSIDYAVMEKLPEGLGLVIPLSAGWSDVGAWDALWQLGRKDTDGNVLQGDVRALSTRNTLAIAQSRLVTLVGLNDVVVVETPDAVLVADQGHLQEIKAIVAQLKREDRPETNTHRKVYRPWGYYDSIDAGDRFQAKRIVVNPGATLSLQLHHHRAEHWVVVRGTARVTRGDEVFLLAENESTYIPIGTRHRLENPGKLPFELIEVQSGMYL